MVGYWPFCGNANDVCGNGNNGTVNGASLTTDRFGTANSAYYFTQSGASFGSNHQSIYIPHNSQFATQSYSVSIWARALNYGWTGNSNVSSTALSKRENSATPGQSSYRIQFEATDWNGSVDPCSNSASPFNLDEWVLLSSTFDGTTLKQYLNGSEVASSACTSNNNATSISGVMLGQTWQYNGYWYHLEGDLDEFGSLE